MSGPIVRPLPARPDLESERKLAKRLLREARGGDPEAIARLGAQNRGLAGAELEQLKLAYAQLTIAREYGFKSWTLLVRYYESFDRQQRSNIHGGRGMDAKFHEGWARTLIAEHRDRRFWTAAALGAFVPRFYGSPIEEIFDAPITEDEARLVVARQNGFGSWEDLIVAANAEQPDQWRDAEAPVRQAVEAMRAGDLPALQRLVEKYPQLRTAKTGRGHVSTLGSNAAILYRRDDSPNGREVLDWIASLGIDAQASLNEQLLGFLGGGMTVEHVERMIEAGADPSWVAPNGYTVLEHAIQRYWNGAAVDAIARRVKPRDTLFVLTGLGDVAGMSRYFDRSGRVTQRARRERPDLTALSGMDFASLADPDDEMFLWELGFVASVNARAEALDFLLARGLKIDLCPGMTLLGFAVGNGLRPMVELLVSRGASPHVRGWRPNQTPLEMCVGYLGQRLDDPDIRRIVQVLGADPDSVAREAEARRGPPRPIPGLTRILTFAQQDAARRGDRTVGIEHFFVGLLASNWSGMELRRFADAGVDLDRLRDHFADRLTADVPVHGAMLPFDADLQAALDVATAHAAKVREGIWPQPVLIYALDTEPIGGIIRAFGGDVQKIKQAIQHSLT